MRLSLRTLRWGAALFAGAGILLVWGVARRVTVPVLHMGDISDRMDWAFVQLYGVVTRYPVYDEESGYLGLWIGDDGDELLVTAYQSTGRALVEEGNVPAIGDVVTVQGTLRVRRDSQSLVLNAPSHLAIERRAPVEMPIARVAEQDLYQKVQVRGQVRQVRYPYEGLTVLSVRDATGSVEIVYDLDLVRLAGAPVQVSPGDLVAVRGAVVRYRGQPQISLDSALGLQRVPGEIAVAMERQIGEIGFADIDRWVRVQGVARDVRALSAGRKCILDDGTGEIALIMWADVLRQVDRQADIRQGVWLDVQGIVTEYRGELEVIPELASDIQVAPATPLAFTASSVVTAVAGTPEPTPTPTSPAMKAPPATPTTVAMPASRGLVMRTGLLTAEHLGQHVTVRGQIEEAIQFASGVRFYVEDGSGSVVVWMPQAIYEQLADKSEWRVGSLVRVTGLVDLYKDEVEVIPRTASDVAITGVGGVLPDTVVPIGSLTASQVGERVTVEAMIAAVVPFSAGIQYVLQDDGGQIVLLLWQNLYDAVPDRELLIDGARVRVTGEIQEYKGELEIVPGIGTDVLLIARD